VCAIKHTAGWEGCSKKRIGVKKWDVAFFMCGCHKPASSHTVKSKRSRVPAFQQPIKLKISEFFSGTGLPGLSWKGLKNGFVI